MVAGMTAFPSASVATSDAASPTDTLSVTELLAALDDGQELAWLDLREAGEFGEGHAFFAVPLPYSRLELDIARLVPRRSTRIVLVDGADGVAARAQLRLRALGYLDVRVLAGGQPAWAASGQPVYQGVNLPSKTFGERVEQAYQTPHLSAQTLHAWQLAGTPHVLLDGRTPEEHRKTTLPGSIPLPNGELALRWRQVVPDATTPIVVHCAGRTRSIVGAEILRGLGLPNPVYALENGTQGWALAGLPLVRGANAQVPQRPDGADTLDADRARAAEAAREAGVPWLDAASAQAWLDDATRTTYVIDVRSAAEFAAGSLAGARHAPGGQLLQATDQHLAVRHARVLLLDRKSVV
jgi:rhodanese-related sulfurtransferase